jgi:hypothetical protein
MNKKANMVLATAPMIAACFRKAQDAITLRERYELVDGIVRETARDYSDTLGTDCDACNAMAASLQGLTSPQAMAKFYAGRTHAFAHKVKQCP